MLQNVLINMILMMKEIIGVLEIIIGGSFNAIGSVKHIALALCIYLFITKFHLHREITLNT